ncbi:hypothetical protein EDC30_102278 [Paucimonas lemoignei]|uniref:Uncharacterized protein n=1 Tax=Paucimonas lemoignei TaxID=29443 RepID=A0A4R3I3N3_PAULE|nr:hypothetical protein [Paucimonas lemoignei]TCS38539.1 hypothetical protein EDC30_102278 [Paucimonas lemoignei]
MTRPDTLFEAASYDLNKFIERRVADRRAMQRDSADRRKQNRNVEQPENAFQKETPSSH